MADVIKLALVGCGGISQAHRNGYKALMASGCREFEVVACCDVLPERAEQASADIAAFQGSTPRVFGSVEELIAARCADAADICAPHYAHHGLAIDLLNAWLHVMVEKPLGITIRASKAIIAAGRRNRRVVATAEQVRRCQNSRAARWAINTRKLIGDVRFAIVQAVDNGAFNYDSSQFKWRGIKLLVGGGMIMDSGAHFTDMIQHVFGAVDEVSCDMRTFDTRLIENAPVLGQAPADVEDTWHIVIRFKSGLLVNWAYCRSAPGQRLANALYYGSQGSLRDLGFPFHCFQGGSEASLADGSKLSNAEIVDQYMKSLSDAERQQLFPYGCLDCFGIEVWDFVDSIRRQRPPEMDGVAGLHSKALCEACFESATLGRPVKYDSVLSGRIRAFQKPIDDFWKL
jgi:predicted dehydrogenase